MSAEQLGAVINRAAEDEDFRTLLVEKPDQALQGYELTHEETQLLHAIPATTQITEIVHRAARDEDFRTLLVERPDQALQGYELTHEETQLLEAVTASETQVGVYHPTDQPSDFFDDSNEQDSGISSFDQSFGMPYPNDALTAEITTASQPTKAIRSGQPPPPDGIIDTSENDVFDAQGNRYFQADPEPKERRRSLIFVLLGLLVMLLACSLIFVLSRGTNTLASPTVTVTSVPLTASYTASPSSTATDTPTPTATASLTPTPTDTPTDTPSGGNIPRETCKATPGDGICCTAAGENSATSYDCICVEHGGQSFAGDICVCPGIIDKVVICADGTKYDNPTTQSCTPSESCGGNDNQPPPPPKDCSGYGKRCNLDPKFGACPAGYTCGGPYDEFNYGTCQKPGCP